MYKLSKIISLFIIFIIISSCGAHYLNKYGEKISIPKRVDYKSYIMSDNGYKKRTTSANEAKLMIVINNKTTGMSKESRGYSHKKIDKYNQEIAIYNDPNIFIYEPGKYEITLQLQNSWSGWNSATIHTTYDERMENDGFYNEKGEKFDCPEFVLTVDDVEWSATTKTQPSVLVNVGSVERSTIDLILNYNRKEVRSEDLTIELLGIEESGFELADAMVQILNKGKEIKDPFPNYVFQFNIGSMSGKFLYKSFEKKYIIKSGNNTHTLNDIPDLLNRIGMIYGEKYLQ